MSHLTTQILWLIPLALQCAIAAAMVRRKLVSRFPVFFSYTVLVPSRDVILLFLKFPSPEYGWVYWIGEALAVLLGLGVILEIAQQLVQPYPFLRFLLKAFWTLALTVTTSALFVLVLIAGPEKVFEPIMMLERAARFLQVCMLIVVLSLMSRLGLSWHQYLVGIVTGFGVYSALDLALLEFRGHLHFVPESAFVLLRSAAYNLAAVIWAIYFLRPWRRNPVGQLPQVDLENWNSTVTGYIGQWYRRYWS